MKNPGLILLVLLNSLLTPLALAGGKEGNGKEIPGGKEGNGKTYAAYGLIRDAKPLPEVRSVDVEAYESNAQPLADVFSENRLEVAEIEMLTEKLRKLQLSAETLNIVLTKLADFRVWLQEHEIIFPLTRILQQAREFQFRQRFEVACSLGNDFGTPMALPGSEDERIRIRYKEHFPDWNIVRLAMRKGNVIGFCRPFSWMTAGHQAATVVHELLYLAMTEKGDLEELVGFLFNQDLLSSSETVVEEAKNTIGRVAGKLNIDWQYIEVKELGTVGEDALADPDTADTFCFGSSLQEGKFYFWHLNGDDECEPGLVYPRGFVALESKETNGDAGFLWVRKSKIAVAVPGEIHLTSLCSGAMAEVCTLDFEGDHINILAPVLGHPDNKQDSLFYISQAGSIDPGHGVDPSHLVGDDEVACFGQTPEGKFLLYTIAAQYGCDAGPKPTLHRLELHRRKCPTCLFADMRVFQSEPEGYKVNGFTTSLVLHRMDWHLRWGMRTTIEKGAVAILGEGLKLMNLCSGTACTGLLWPEENMAYKEFSDGTFDLPAWLEERRN